MTRKEWLYKALKQTCDICDQTIAEVLKAIGLRNDSCSFCIYSDQRKQDPDLCEGACTYGRRIFLDNDADGDVARPGTMLHIIKSSLNEHIVNRCKYLHPDWNCYPQLT